MSPKRLGRLFGSLLLISALVVVPGLLTNTSAQGYDWQMPVLHSLVP